MNKKINLITAVAFLVLLFGVALASLIIPDKDFSDDENRTLQTLPDINLPNWLDGTLASRFNDYFTDQFPLRDAALTLSGLSDLALGRAEANGVLVGDNGHLAVRRFDAYTGLTSRAHDTDYFSETHIKGGTDALAALSDKLSAEGIALTVLIAPRTIDVTVSSFDYPADLSDRLNRTIQDSLIAHGLDSIDLLDTFRISHEAGEYVYYRTDHHWTTGGAYRAYRALMESWDMTEDILHTSDFTVRTVGDFYGTTWSRAGLAFVSSDTIEIWEAPDDSVYVLSDENGDVIQRGFIDESYLSTKDKYGAFLSGTRRFVTVTKESVGTHAAGENITRPRLLIAKDSFANTVAPFLARHFDLVLVNLTGGMTDLSAYAEQYDCDRVLVLCNLENAVTGDALNRVK